MLNNKHTCKKPFVCLKPICVLVVLTCFNSKRCVREFYISELFVLPSSPSHLRVVVNDHQLFITDGQEQTITVSRVMMVNWSLLKYCSIFLQ